MPSARRLFRVPSNHAPATWQWHGSTLDDMGGCMVANFDGTNWFTGSDIGGIHKMKGDIATSPTMPQFDAGRSNTSTNTLNNDLHKAAAIKSNGTMAYTLAGDGSNGGIHSRNLLTDSKWTLRSTDYYGNVKGSIGLGRPVGSRRICINDVTNCVYIACQSLTNGSRGGIAVSKSGGAFADFHSASTFTIGRMFRALQNSVNWSDLLYATADNQIGVGATIGNAPGVFVYIGASTASPSVVQIDTAGAGGPALVDWKDMCVVNENGKDVLYIACGYLGGVSGAGIWRCTINTNPNTWGGTANVSWLRVHDPGAAIDYRNIYAWRTLTDTATYVIGTTNPAQPGAANPPNLSGTIPNSGGKKYVREIVRSLNAHTASPTWDAITNDINLSPGGTLLPVYGTTETWLQETGSMNSALNNYLFVGTILGGVAHEVFDIDVDPISQRAVIAGKQGAWLGQNVWSSTLSDITWQPFSMDSGNCTNHGVEVHPTNNLAYAHSDTDRMFYFNIDGGENQDRGIAARYAANPPIGQSSFIRQGTVNQGRLLIGSDGAKVQVSDDWFSVPNIDTAPTIATDAVTSSSGTIVAVGEWTYSGTTYRLALDDTGAWNLKKNAGSWAIIGTSVGALTASTHGEYRVIVNDDFADCWVMISSKGIYYCPDISAASPTFTRIWNQAAGSQSYEGSFAQDPFTRTTLYVTWGKGLNGIWKLTRADATTYTTSGANVTVSGVGTATNIATGSTATTKPYGPLDVDYDGSLVVTEPGYTGIGDIHLRENGASLFSSIADPLYPEVAQGPNSIRKRGNRIYIGVFTSGCIYGKFS